MKNIFIFIISLFAVSTMTAAYVPNSYDTQADAAVKAVIGQQVNGSNYLSATPVEVNVKSFGAKGDGVTDDTAAFQAAIDTITNTGGIINIPSGIFFINGNFVLPPGSKSMTNFSQLHLPARDLVTQNILTFWFKGVARPTLNTVWTTNSLPVAPTNGSIILTTKTPISPFYSWIGSGAPSTSPYTLSAIYTIFENLDIRLTDNPQASGMNLSKIAQATVRNCIIETGTGGGNQSQSVSNVYGLITPEINNWVISEVYNVDIRGFHCGAMFNEHTDADDIRFWLCPVAMQFPGGTHAIHIGHSVVTGCTRGVIGGLPGGFVQRITWDSYAVEHSILTTNNTAGDSRWANSLIDFDDTNSVLRGIVHFAAVQSGAGANDTFVIGGATNITFFNLNNHSFNQLSIKSPGTNEPVANYLLSIADSNGTPVTVVGHYLQPFQQYIGLWMGPESSRNPWQLATNFTILSDGTNQTTINVGQPQGGSASKSAVYIQVGHITVATFSNNVITFVQPLNHGFIAISNFISGKLYTNTYAGPVHLTATVQCITAAVAGNSAMQLQIPGIITNSIGFTTAATIPADGGIFAPLLGDVPSGFSFTFTNTSTGAGNSTVLFPMQIKGD